MRFFFVLLLIMHFAGSASGQLFETRAVWFATVLGDGNWPESSLDSAEKQEADLRDRIRTAAANGMNTFVFQAVARGDAMYPSERLPWSWRLTTSGGDPGYDPLAVAVDEAHKLGIELHAWVNVFYAADTSNVKRYADAAEPAHVYYEHPEWMKVKGREIWLDPSSDEAREWLVGNVMEIVENYDVDAIHYDFIRYAQGAFSDDLANCQFEGPCPDLGQWRRENVTAVVRDSYNAVYTAKPWVKVGATPIGHYQGPYEWGFFSAYNEAYQASREWMPAFADYLAPQIYWSIGQVYDPPRFEVLADEWVRESEGPIFIGMPAYGADPAAVNSPFPPEDLPAQIEVARQVGAEGHVFFRYDHFLKYAHYILPKYPDLAL
ncbi:MAG: family 10 glycosylhydrolase, partial [Rhodothermales bacterium]